MDASIEAKAYRALAEEQAALRRVATLVARGAVQQDVFAGVVEEIGKLLNVDFAILGRYEAERSVLSVASWSVEGDAFPVGARWPLGGRNSVTRVFETGRPARIDDFGEASGTIGAEGKGHGFRSSLGAPIFVQDQLWGCLAVGATERSAQLAPDTEMQLVSFTELVASAIANAQGRGELAELVEEQAALRRVATLVARGASPTEVFAAVTEEVGRLLPVEYAILSQYEPAAKATCVATWGITFETYRPGDCLTLGGKNLLTLVYETGRSARIDDYSDASGSLGEWMRASPPRSAVGTPIMVESRLWGTMIAGSTGKRRLPEGTEVRLADFTELVAVAIANSESHAQLIASRARIAAAADETRRQIERDLHDGTQQQLVSLLLELREANARASEVSELHEQLARTADRLDDVLSDLRELSRGIHPALLSRAGLNSALRALGRRSGLPVELDLRCDQRFPEQVEVAAYYVVSEALTNAAKHSGASVVTVELDVLDTNLWLTIRDDGVGGADPKRGSGLVGLADRLEALGGRIEVTSERHRGTSLSIEIPLVDYSTVVAAGQYE